MKRFVLLFAILAILSTSYAQICRGNLDRLRDSTSDVCPFKGGKTCCDSSEEEGVRMVMDIFRNAGFSSKCIDHYRGLMCFDCDPMNTYTDFNFCRSYCEKLVKDCFNFDGIDNYFGDLICQELPESGQCFNGFSFPPLPPRFFCSQFGDPHIRTFDNKFLTCLALGQQTVFKSNKITITVDNKEIGASGASFTDSMTLVYKEGSSTEFEYTFERDKSANPPKNSDKVVVSGGGFSGRINFLELDTSVAFQITRSEVFFSISTPDKGESSAMCNRGCPSNTLKVLQTYEEHSKCESLKGTDYYNLCNHDMDVDEESEFHTASLKVKEHEDEYKLLESLRKERSSGLKTTVGLLCAVIGMLAVVLF